MGLKRKASEFEEAILSPESKISPVPSLSSSPLSATSSTHSNTFNNRPYDFWNIGSVPFLNSRTRKRYRDGRPSEETIYEDTLKKLYEGQRRLNAEAEEGEHNIPDLIDTGSPHAIEDMDVELSPAPTQNTLVEQNQRKIESFFGGRRSAQPNIYDHVRAQVVQPIHTFGKGHRAEPLRTTTLTCEDCSAPLSSGGGGDSLDAEMMDSDVPLLPSQFEEEWSCNACGRVVCDTCAVRGDSRVCLECAGPGAGNMKQSVDGILERRWVGGIGWM